MMDLGFTHVAPDADIYVPMKDVIGLGIPITTVLLISRITDADRVESADGDLVPCGLVYSAIAITSPATAAEFLEACHRFAAANPPPINEPIQ